MPRAEVGTPKHMANQLRKKGLQRLRWYCQVCERQMMDANGFKMHTQSESHVRQMIIVGEDPKKYINNFSNQFLRDFLQLLRTGHGEKQVHMNQFYQEYISNKEHIHMNATKWTSLTEFAKHLGREGICRVEDSEKGLLIAWIDNSPEALKRQDALRRKEAQDQGDEQVEKRIIQEQIRRAQANAANREAEEVDNEEARNLNRQDGEKIKLSFGVIPKPEESKLEESKEQSLNEDTVSSNPDKHSETSKEVAKPSGLGAFSLKMGVKPQTKNVFAQAKKNALAGGSFKKSVAAEQPQKMSEAERIMRQELERKRPREPTGFNMPLGKKQRSN